MKKILWVSRHNPMKVQRAELERLFGAVEVIQDSKPFSNAKEIKRRYEKGHYDDLVVVAPLWVIFHLTELGIKPLWVEMLEVLSIDEYHLSYNGRFYQFMCFKRIEGVEIKFSELIETE